MQSKTDFIILLLEEWTKKIGQNFRRYVFKLNFFEKIRAA